MLINVAGPRFTRINGRYLGMAVLGHPAPDWLEASGFLGDSDQESTWRDQPVKIGFKAVNQWKEPLGYLRRDKPQPYWAQDIKRQYMLNAKIQPISHLREVFQC